MSGRSSGNLANRREAASRMLGNADLGSVLSRKALLELGEIAAENNTDDDELGEVIVVVDADEEFGGDYNPMRPNETEEEFWAHEDPDPDRYQ